MYIIVSLFRKIIRKGLSPPKNEDNKKKVFPLLKRRGRGGVKSFEIQT